jgi:phytoene synthase
MNQSQEIFKRGSKTYYHSSIFFDKDTRENVSTLYAFVRTADDFVDSVPSRKKEYFAFKKQYYDLLKDKHIKKSNYDSYSDIILNFIVLSREFNFEQKWIDSFFKSMEFDLEKKICKNRLDVQNYIHGSAEVIGLMMSRILLIDKKADSYSKALGESMQLINFIRDVKEDYILGRIYLPELYSKKLLHLNNALDKKNESEIKRIIRSEIDNYLKVQKQAEKGFKFIKKRYLVAIKTASDMYKYTAQKIYNDPMSIFREKVKPSKLRVIFCGIKNLLTL